MLELCKIGKAFAGGAAAVKNLSLTLADGEVFVLLGPSGCGKTTTLRIIAGLERPSSGRCSWMALTSPAGRRKSGTSAWSSRTTPSSPT